MLTPECPDCLHLEARILRGLRKMNEDQYTELLAAVKGEDWDKAIAILAPGFVARGLHERSAQHMDLLRTISTLRAALLDECESCGQMDCTGDWAACPQTECHIKVALVRVEEQGPYLPGEALGEALRNLGDWWGSVEWERPDGGHDHIYRTREGDAGHAFDLLGDEKLRGMDADAD